ncbi:hypothetical protein V8C42DRAFT_320976 [Trichoderma barbatum]
MRLPRPSFRSLGLPPRKLPLQQQHRISQTALKVQRPSSYIFSPRRSYSSVISAANLLFGQPVHETHPHILKAGEGGSPFTL